jgi:hypothetical protein
MKTLQAILYRLIRFLLILLLLTTLFSCSNRKLDNVKGKLTNDQEAFALPAIAAIDVNFPLSLEDIDLQDDKNGLHLNDGINSRIEETIKDYYFNECSGDSNEINFKVKAVYINTIRLHDSLHTIFLILLNHPTGGRVNSKVLIYNNETKDFADKTLDFNIHALYDFENGKLNPTNLKTAFEITTPEIEIVDFNKDGLNDYKFTRLLHNGTFNSIQTTIISVANNQIDTLYFKEKDLVK